MIPTRTSAIHIALAILLLAAGTALWIRHARDWDLGRSASVLSYDAAQYALAARELAEHGRLATPYALPVELVRHATPPWPLALVQPGLVAFEAALFRIDGGARARDPRASARREWLVLALPVACYLGTALLFALGASVLLGRHAPGLPPILRAAAGGVVGLAFLLDPEAQHAAAGGFTELPFTLGLGAAIVAIALGSAARRPLAFGLLLGFTGWFRGNMLWLAPVLALAAAAAGPDPGAPATDDEDERHAGAPEGRARPERRAALDHPSRPRRTFALALAGYALVLAPWWIYKWVAFGSPGWDLAWISIWDGVRGQTWFSLNHLPELPAMPAGWDAVREITAKIVRNLFALILQLTAGPRAAWIAALLFWTLSRPEPRTLRWAGIAALGVMGVSLFAAAASVPIERYLFPARVVAEAAGILALWGLISTAPATLLSAPGRRFARLGLAVLVVGWGAYQTARSSAGVRAASHERGVPPTHTLIELVERMDREMTRDEPVMSNLGPILAWYARRPVVHLALTPADVEACRQRVELRHVVLVFREAERAWPQWIEVLRRPEEAARDPELNIARARRFRTADGFLVVWLEMGPPRTRVAWATEAGDRDEAAAPTVAAGEAGAERGGLVTR